MEPLPLFDSPEQAITVSWRFIGRLARLLLLTMALLAHVALAVVVLGLLWAFQATPTGVASAFLAWLQTTTAAVLGFAGLSATALLSGYVWLLRRLLRAAHSGPMLDYLLQDVRPKDDARRR